MAQENSRKDYIEAIKSSFLTIAKKNVMSKLLAAAPFLAWGPLPGITGMLVEWILSKAIDGAETGIFFLYVDFRVAVQSKKFTDAAIENYRIQQNGTKEEKDAAEKRLIAAFDDFVKLNRI